jgi:hypothetical protein
MQRHLVSACSSLRHRSNRMYRPFQPPTPRCSQSGSIGRRIIPILHDRDGLICGQSLYQLMFMSSLLASSMAQRPCFFALYGCRSRPIGKFGMDALVDNANGHKRSSLRWGSCRTSKTSTRHAHTLTPSIEFTITTHEVAHLQSEEIRLECVK